MKKKTSFLEEFKTFIMRGNILDLAVAVIIGGAFGKIVTSLVNDILMPVIGAILGGHSFVGLSFDLNGSQVMYGSFIQNIVDFLIIAACIFLLIKFVAKFKKAKEEKEEAITKTDEVIILEEIRDLLKKDAKAKKK